MHSYSFARTPSCFADGAVAYLQRSQRLHPSLSAALPATSYTVVNRIPSLTVTEYLPSTSTSAWAVQIIKVNTCEPPAPRSSLAPSHRVVHRQYLAQQRLSIVHLHPSLVTHHHCRYLEACSRIAHRQSVSSNLPRHHDASGVLSPTDKARPFPRRLHRHDRLRQVPRFLSRLGKSMEYPAR
jgi:hypothetical protein